MSVPQIANNIIDALGVDAVFVEKTRTAAGDEPWSYSSDESNCTIRCVVKGYSSETTVALGTLYQIGDRMLLIKPGTVIPYAGAGVILTNGSKWTIQYVKETAYKGETLYYECGIRAWS